MIFTFLSCIFKLLLFFHFSLHCLDSMIERLGRIISNTFTITLTCVEHRYLIDHATIFLRASCMKASPPSRAPSALSAALLITSKMFIELYSSKKHTNKWNSQLVKVSLSHFASLRLQYNPSCLTFDLLFLEFNIWFRAALHAYS